MESFMLAFDSNLAPIVGQQVTLDAGNAAVAGPRIDLLEARAAVGECDLVVKGRRYGQELGFLMRDGVFLPSRGGRWLNDTVLRKVARQAPLTFTCVPPGSGPRMAGIREECDHQQGED
jgi:hypothetical protein